MQVIVHGGAGSPPAQPEQRQHVLDEAAEQAVDADTPLKAVETAVNHLEASPRFNAGRGSVAQVDGQIRTDAGVMTGEYDAGAVCGLQGVTHPITVARHVLEHTPHVLISGEHAQRLAQHYDIPTDDNLWSDTVRQGYDAASPPQTLDEQLEWTQGEFGALNSEDAHRDHDTVGAVAVADNEQLAAATSTGGRWFALAGRVGDTPQIGSGFYASPAAGASATGAGEAIAKTTLSERAVRYTIDGHYPEDAARKAVIEYANITGEHAGVIVANRDGHLGSYHNADEMQTSTASSE